MSPKSGFSGFSTNNRR